MGLEIQRDPIDAITQAGRGRAVRKHVAQMSSAPAAVDLFAHHSEAAIPRAFERALDRCKETRPTGAALELPIGHEQGLAAGGAFERSLAMLVQQGAGTRPLRSVAAKDRILVRSQNPAPLFIGFRHWIPFLSHGSPCA